MFKTDRMLRFLVVLVALSLAVPVLADSFSKHLTLTEPAKLGGTQLKAGEYRLDFDGSKVTMKQGSKVLAEAKGEWAEMKSAAPGDSFVVDNGAITEIRIENSKRVIKIR